MVRLSTQNIYSMFSWEQITLKVRALRFTLHPNMCTHAGAPDAEAIRLIYGLWMETLMRARKSSSVAHHYINIYYIYILYMNICAMTTLNDLKLDVI